MQDNKDFKPKMLFAICFPEKAEWFIETLKAGGAHGITANIAKGVKKSTLAGLLGFEDSKRILVTAVIDTKDIEPLFEKLKHELFFEPNTGLAFTVNMDAHAGARSMLMIDAFLQNYLDSIDEEEEDTAEIEDEEKE